LLKLKVPVATQLLLYASPVAYALSSVLPGVSYDQGMSFANRIHDSGQAIVSRKGVELATLGPGDHFGEIALIDGGPRSATVTAATDLVCYGLTFWEFRPLVERNGTIGWKILQALAKRMRAVEDHASAAPQSAKP